MPSSSKKIDWYFVLLFGYLIISCAFAVFWSKNFSLYTEKKGEEYFYLIGYNIGIAIFCFVVYAAIMRKFRLMLLSLIPILTIFPAAIITLVVGLGVKSTTTSDLIIYGIVYPLINLLTYHFFKTRLFKSS